MKKTQPEQALAAFQAQRAFFRQGHTRSVLFRKTQLQNLQRLLRENEEDLMAALAKDFRKPGFEAYTSEIGVLYKELNLALAKLNAWTRPKSVKTPITLWPSKSRVYYEPKGNVLIIAPWNYPIQLLLAPAIAALAAGNTALLKPAEQTPHTAELLAELVSRYFPREVLYVALGEGHSLVPYLFAHCPFDHVFFTGSTAVGRKIAAMAAPQLIPVTLELGGKSPALIDESAHLNSTVRRLAFGKWLNAGQTCVAPDYVLVQESRKEAFLRAMQSTLQRFYPQGALGSTSYASIIHQDRFDTLVGYLDQGKVHYGGDYDAKNLRIAPTLLEPEHLEAPVMQEEIFGPILPVLPYRNLDEALHFLAGRAQPLAAYIFSRNEAHIERFVRQLSFGGGAVNNAVLHLANAHLPFGGIGESGYGDYHGRFGFETFSHRKAVMRTATWFDLPQKFPPYKAKALGLVKRILR